MARIISPSSPFDTPPILAALGIRSLGGRTVTGINKYGLADDGVQTTATDIWDRADSTPTQQLWVAPTQARTHDITSDDTEDDGTPEGAGSGAQAVRIYGLQTWDSKETSEDVTLNGTANVATANSYVIIYRMKVIQVGSTYNINAGNITATAQTDASVTAQINIGRGQTNMAIYAIASTQTMVMTHVHLNAHNVGNPGTVTDVDFEFLVNERPDLDETVFLNKHNAGSVSSGSTQLHRPFDPFYLINGPAIMKVQAIASTADIEGSAEFEGYIIDD